MREKTEITHYPDKMVVRQRSSWAGPVPTQFVRPKTERELLREKLGLDSIGESPVNPRGPVR